MSGSNSTQRLLSVPSSTMGGRTVTGGNQSASSATVSLGLVGVATKATSSSISSRSRSNDLGAPSSAGQGVVRRSPSSSQTNHRMSTTASASSGSSVNRGMPVLAPIARRGLADPTFPPSRSGPIMPSVNKDKESSCSREVPQAAATSKGSGEVTTATNGKVNAVNVGEKEAYSPSEPRMPISSSSSQAVLSVDARNILRDIERFDFGGKLGELMRELGGEEGGGDDGDGQGDVDDVNEEKDGDEGGDKGQKGKEIEQRATKSSALIPTPPRAARRPVAAGRVAEAGGLGVQSSATTRDHGGSSSHEIACGGDEPLPIDDDDEKALAVRDVPSAAVGGDGGGPLARLRPANLPGFNVSERARQQNALSYFDDENPDVIVMAQKVTLLDNYSKVGGPLWEEDKEGGPASVGGGPHSAAAAHRAFLAAQSGARHSDEQFRACASFGARASKKGLYFHHIVGELRKSERALADATLK